MRSGRPAIGQILVRRGVINARQLEAALNLKAEQRCRLGAALVTLGHCTEMDIAQALSEQLEIPYVDLQQTQLEPDAVAQVPGEIALAYGIMPFRLEHQRLYVAMQDPLDLRVDELLRKTTDYPVVIVAAPESQVWECARRHYGETAPSSVLSQHAETPGEMEVSSEEPLTVDQVASAATRFSAIQIVNTILSDAVRRDASDVHIEPDTEAVRVRYRVDGQMQPVVNFSREHLLSVVARIKVVSGMDISESRKPQDGGCRLRIDGRVTELRVSTLPGVWGESVVIRLLGRDSSVYRLDALGLCARALREMRGLLEERNGMVLVTGPTGSGKTTTLYAALNHLKDDALKIITAEDPVEAKLSGVTQVQIHDRAGRSFSQTLRAMLRQDPDVMMVGEIRDAETADIACRAALTGHLVLSTLHTRHALGTIARLIDLGVPGYLLGGALNGVLAQRLARRVCERCAERYDPPAGLLALFERHFGLEPTARFRKGRGCPSCHLRGTRGRVGIHELLVLDDECRRMLAGNAPTTELKQYVEQRGFQTMEQDAFQKACCGLIPPEEVVALGLSLSMMAEELALEPLSSAAEPLPNELSRVFTSPVLAGEMPLALTA